MLNQLSDYTYKSIIADKTGVEGGYVNDPDDRGGETNHGITVGLATQYKAQLVAKFAWDGTMRNLSLDMAFWLYKTHFWDLMRLDDVMTVHPLIADKLFDIGINTGKSPAVRMLQSYLNVMNNQGTLYPDMAEDGGLGPTTLNNLRAYVKIRGNEGIHRLLVGMLCFQGAYYRDISINRSTNEKFTYGWIGRVTRDIGHYAKLLNL